MSVFSALRSAITPLLLVMLLLCNGWVHAAGGVADEALPELYRVSTVRAAPGKLLAVIALYQQAHASGHWQRTGDAEPMLMRHSQGDHWDLMVVQPISSYAAYYQRDRIERRERAAAEFTQALDALIAFREDLFAYGPAQATVEKAWQENALYHIEMFSALAGKHDELLHQRRIENDYLQAIGNRRNLVFVGDQGSDVDVFTIGFYPSLVEFAAPAAVSDEAAEAAAKAAGFQGRAFIGTYLRELLASHHDTLAVKVPSQP